MMSVAHALRSSWMASPSRSGHVRAVVLLVLLVVGVSAPRMSDAQTRENVTGREITPIRGGLYQVREGTQHTVFLVTADGIVLVDPLGTATASWLAGELKNRFPGRTVRYVVLTHHHFDRAEGASAFDDTAEIVAHNDFDRELRRAHGIVPPFLADYHLSGNGWVQRNELSGEDDFAAAIASRDRNGDGGVTLEELYSGVRTPESHYGSRRTITLGSSTVELVHVGGAHAADMTLLYFPAERVVFAADPPPVARVPFAFEDAAPRDAASWLRALSALDYERLVTGDGATVERAHLVALQAYLERLIEIVASGYAAGMTLTEMQSSPTLRPVSNSPHYEARASQVEAVYRRARLLYAEVSGAALFNRVASSAGYCLGADVCASGGSVPGGSVAMRFGLGRRLRLGLELTSSSQISASRTEPGYNEDYAFRATRATFLVGYGSPRRRISYTVLGGGSWTVGDTSGSQHFDGRLLPGGGRHAFEARTAMIGITGGVDVDYPLGSRITLRFPFRMTRLVGNPAWTWPQELDFQIGAGLSYRWLHRVQTDQPR